MPMSICVVCLECCRLIGQFFCSVVYLCSSQKINWFICLSWKCEIKIRLKLHFHCSCFKSSQSRLEDNVDATTTTESSWKSILSCLNVWHLEVQYLLKK